MKQKVYRYYSTQRPIGPGTIPSAVKPLEIVNYEFRHRIDPWGFGAWGYLEYAVPLTEQQIDDYELLAWPKNPDEAQRIYELAQVVGKWERSHRVYASRRITWWHPDFGSFVPKASATLKILQERYEFYTGGTNKQ